jgi:sulfur-oxidizing protein SoxA
MTLKTHAIAGLSAIALMFAAAGAAQAQEKKDDTIKGIEAYREMLKDGNPAELFEMSGEELWKKPAGPKGASLERCDLGLGAGKVEGAFAQLPRYFADTDKVQDLESRLLTCMASLQGIDPKEYIDARFGSVFRRRGDPALVLG